MIEIHDLVVKYGDFTAVKGIDLAIQEGEFFTFLGPSGCGKTTTLRSISGFEKPAGGTIFSKGIDLTQLLPEQRNIGFVFQNYALFPSMTVYENIAFGLKIKKLDKQSIRQKVENVAETTGITEHLGKKISDLSGGQQQRVAVARALVIEPDILLMDEPLSNLDAKLRIVMREEIKKLQTELGITTIYVTHDQEEALAISDRIAVFNDGMIDQIGNPVEVYENPKTEFAAKFIGDISPLTGALKNKIRKQLHCEDCNQLYVRPHKIHIGSKPEQENLIETTVRVNGFEFLGAYSKIMVQPEDSAQFDCLVFGRPLSTKVGDELTCTINVSDILIY